MIPHLETIGRQVAVRVTEDGPVCGWLEEGPNMAPFGYTVGFGWHTGLPTLGAALDALLADPRFGVK